MSKVAKKHEKEAWAIEKPKLDNARKLRGIYFVDPEEEEYEETRRKRKKDTRNSFGRGCALQDRSKKAFSGATGNCSEWRHSHTQENQSKLVLW